MRGALSLLILGGLLSLPLRAGAELRLEAGGHYWVGRSGLFEAGLAVETRMARALSVGGRFGGFVTTGPGSLGVPLDLTLRFHLARGQAWLAAYGGAFLDFGGGTWLRGHASVAFGLKSHGVLIGLEIGYLQPAPLMGLRFAWRI